MLGKQLEGSVKMEHMRMSCGDVNIFNDSDRIRFSYRLLV